MITVSFTEFRDKLPKYLEDLSKGKKITVMNAKKGKKLVTLVAGKEEEFDWDEHMKFVKSLGGSGLLSNEEDEKARKVFRQEIDERFNDAVQR
jgi:antitoxin (DNA-binding transcriptional repressor) of toxin-antitoxin stability system